MIIGLSPLKFTMILAILNHGQLNSEKNGSLIVCMWITLNINTYSFFSMITLKFSIYPIDFSRLCFIKLITKDENLVKHWLNFSMVCIDIMFKPLHPSMKALDITLSTIITSISIALTSNGLPIDFHLATIFVFDFFIFLTINNLSFNIFHATWEISNNYVIMIYALSLLKFFHKL